MTDASDFYRITSVDVARLCGLQHEAVVMEFGIEHSEETILLWLLDAEAYEFIRKLTDVLFDVDPPRSGVGSPGATASDAVS